MTMTVWTLSTSDGPLRAQRVVLATGACTKTRIPNWSGRDTFKPPLIHSSQYRNPSAYRGQRVLVVGAGNSAAEIAADLAEARDVTVEMAVRTPPTILRRDTHGVPTQPVGIALRYAPPAIVNPLGSRPASHRRFPICPVYGLSRPKAPYSQFQRTGTVPVLDHGFVAAVRSGAITIRTAVMALDGRDVIHADGFAILPDAVVAATGYTSGLNPILGPLGLLDDRDLPTIGSRGGPEAVGLYTVGISIPLSGLLERSPSTSAAWLRAIARLTAGPTMGHDGHALVTEDRRYWCGASTGWMTMSSCSIRPACLGRSGGWRSRPVDELVDAIRRLAVRGAPLLGAAGALGVLLAVQEAKQAGWDDSTAARCRSAAAGRPGRRR